MAYYPSSSRLFLILSIVFSALLLSTQQALASVAPELEYIQRATSYRDAGNFKAAVIELKNALQRNPTDQQARLQLGKLYLNMGLFANAEKELRRAARLGAGAQDYLVPLGQVLLQLGNFDVLLDELQPVTELSSQVRAEVLALRGDAFLQDSEIEQAHTEFQKALQADSINVRALLGQARLALGAGSPIEASKLVEQALANDPTSVSGWNLRGDMEQSEGRLEAARNAYSQAIEHAAVRPEAKLKRAMVNIDLQDYDAAMEDVEALKTSGWTNPGIFYAEGLVQFRHSRFDQAREAFERVVNNQPSHIAALAYLGASDYALGNLQQAENHLSQVLLASPAEDDSARLLGVIRFRLGDFTGAEAALRPLLSRRPDDALVLRLLGKSLVSQGKAEEGNSYLKQAVALQPDAAAERLDLAVSLLSLGKREQAMQELEKAVELEPAMRQAEMLLIRENLQARELDQVLLRAQRLREKYPDDPTPLTLMGMAHAAQDNLQQARKLFEQVLQLQPGQPSASHNLAVLALKDGDIQKARAYYEQALEQHPAELNLMLKLAQFELRQGNRDGYRQQLQAAVKKHPAALEPRVRLAHLQVENGKPLQALTTLREAPEEHAEHPLLLAAQGEAQLAAGQASSAVHSLEQAVELEPQSAHGHYLLASAYAETKDLSGLRTELLAGLRLNSTHPQTTDLIRRLLALSESPAQTEAILVELKQLIADHPLVIDTEGQLALRQQQPEQALLHYRSALLRHPHNPQWPFRLSGIQWLAGDKETSLSTLEGWLKDHPDNVRLWSVLANNYLVLERRQAAKAAFARVVELAPNNTLALNNLAWLLREEDPQQALMYAEKASGLSPDDATVMDTLGVLLIQQGQAGRAVDVLQEAVKRRPDMPTIKYHLATALVQKGEMENARKELSRILNLNRGFPERDAAQELLSELTN